MASAFAALKEKLFTPNNHSKYEVGWKEVPPELHKEFAALLQNHYEIESVQEIHQVDEYERASNNFRCRVRWNNGLRTVLLRKHVTRRANLESIALVDRTIHHLQEHGIPTPALLLTVDGVTVFQEADQFYQLFEFVEGAHYRGTNLELIHLARQLPRLHMALNLIPFADEIRRKPFPWPQWTLEGWSDFFDRARVGSDYYDRLVADAEGLILGQGLICQEALKDQTSLHEQVLHGDLHPLNTIFEAEELKVFLDFGETRVDELLRDIGTGLHRFVRQYVVYRNKDWRIWLPLAVSVFIEEYAEVNPISDCDIALLPSFLCDDLLRKMFDNLNNYFVHGSTRSIDDGELEKKLILLQEASVIRDVVHKFL